MRYKLLLVLGCLLLSGCGAQEMMETVADEWMEEVMAPAREILVALPEEADAPAAENADGRLYLCSDYEIQIHTMEAGDLDATIQAISGCAREDLTVIETQPQGLRRYDFVWTTVGEGGDWVGRAVILDDGGYHYTMSVLRPSTSVESSQIVWRTVFESFTLA